MPYVWSMYLVFVHNHATSKIETKQKNGRESDVKLIVGLNLNSGDVRNCKEITFVQKRKPQFGVYTRTFISKVQRPQKV